MDGYLPGYKLQQIESLSTHTIHPLGSTHKVNNHLVAEPESFTDYTKVSFGLVGHPT